MSKSSLPQGIVNPFSEKFITEWDLYKQYRWEEHKFKYKGCLSEQAALMKLNELSGGNEEIAKKIIRQSMENGWRGLFEYKNNSNGQQSSIEQFRSAVQAERTIRREKRKQAGN